MQTGVFESPLAQLLFCRKGEIRQDCPLLAHSEGEGVVRCLDGYLSEWEKNKKGREKRSPVNGQSHRKRHSPPVAPLAILGNIKKPLYAFMKLKLPTLSVLIFFMAALVVAFLHYFLQIYNSSFYDAFGFSLCVAKGSAGVIMTNTTLLLLAACDGVWEQARAIKCLKRCLPMNKTIFHEVCAYTMLAFSIIHAFCHISGTFPSILRTIHPTHGEAIEFAHSIRLKAAQSLSVSEMLSSESSEALARRIYSSLPFSTGIVMLVAVSSVAIASTMFVRRRCFHVFRWIHIGGGMAFLTCLHLHGRLEVIHPQQIFYFTGVPLTLLLYKYSFIVCRRVTGQDEAMAALYPFELGSDKLLLLEVHHYGNIDVKPGNYVKVNVPFLSNGYHAFTPILIQPGNEGRLRFLIKVAGDFTNKLFEHARLENRTIMIRLQGPFGSSSSNLTNFSVLRKKNRELVPTSSAALLERQTKYASVYINSRQRLIRLGVSRRHVIIVATGVGITPFLTNLDTLQKVDDKKEHCRTPLTLIWIVRSINMALLFSRTMNALLRQQQRFQIFLYVTGSHVPWHDFRACPVAVPFSPGVLLPPDNKPDPQSPSWSPETLWCQSSRLYWSYLRATALTEGEIVPYRDTANRWNIRFGKPSDWEQLLNEVTNAMFQDERNKFDPKWPTTMSLGSIGIASIFACVPSGLFVDISHAADTLSFSTKEDAQWIFTLHNETF